MPGVVKEVMASVGQTVKAGETLIVMEAMKMEMTLSAPRDGTIGEVRVAAGQQVSDGAILISLEAEEQAA